MAPAEQIELLTTIYGDVGGTRDVPEELLPCLPRDKSDAARLKRAVSLGFPAVEPILPHLLRWLQDLNWPISRDVGSFLRSVGDPLAEPIRQVFRSRDDSWKRSVLTELVKDGSPRLRHLLAGELRRIAEYPSEGELAEDVPEVALEILHGVAGTPTNLNDETEDGAKPEE